MDFIFDVAELAPGMGKSLGIFNYARRLFEAMLPILGPTCRMHLACNAASAIAFDANGNDFVIKHTVINGRSPSTFQRQWWLRWGAQHLSRRLGVFVYVTPKGFIPGWWGASRGLRTISVIHDLIPLWYQDRYPGYFGRLHELIVNQGLLRAAKWADEVVAISGATADEIVRRVGHRDRIHILYNGVHFVEARTSRPLSDSYIFAITSPLPHKNSTGLLAAYAKYRALAISPLPLVICGINDPLQPGVTVIRGVDDETLHTYYKHAKLFIFLSLTEGFGFPPLEAMSHGTPVLCSDIDAIKEVTAGAAFLVDPLSLDSVAAEMINILSNDDLRLRFVDKGLCVVSRYNWRDVAQDVLKLLEAC